MIDSNVSKVLVFGATGATGRLVVNQLLSRGIPVVAVSRSQEKMKSLVERKDDPNLSIKEGSVYHMSEDELTEILKDCSVAVSCLGHNITFKGVYGKGRDLVENTAMRVTGIMEKQYSSEPKKFILMGTVGAANKLAEKDEIKAKGWGERFVLQIIRTILPPHRDNEKAADYMADKVGPRNEKVEWVVVRPDGLIDEPVSEYDVYPSPPAGLFNAKVVSRSNVAQFMSELIANKSLWETWKFKMPAIINKNQPKK